MSKGTLRFLDTDLSEQLEQYLKNILFHALSLFFDWAKCDFLILSRKIFTGNET